MKINLRSKSDRKKGLWMLALKKGTYTQYMHNDYMSEAKYINSLSDSEKEWLNTFLRAYYHMDKKSMDKLQMPIEMRRSRYNQHRGAKNEIFNKRARNALNGPVGELLIVSQIDFEKESSEENEEKVNKLKNRSLN